VLFYHKKNRSLRTKFESRSKICTTDQVCTNFFRNKSSSVLL